MDTICKTRYPILLIHGCGFRETSLAQFWGRIPAALAEHGADMYFAKQEAWISVEDNALLLKQHIEKLIKTTGCEKINLIAHSKGGHEARMLASSLGMHEHIASITLFGTPNYGSETVDFLLKTPKFIKNVLVKAVNAWFRRLGDRNPDFMTVVESFSTAYAEKFNESNPDMPDVFYQSVTGYMPNAFADKILMFPYLVVRHFDGECDGLVSIKSASWGNTVRILRSGTKHGISHEDLIDFRRRQFGKNGSGDITDIRDVYIDILSDLRERGY